MEALDGDGSSAQKNLEFNGGTIDQELMRNWITKNRGHPPDQGINQKKGGRNRRRVSEGLGSNEALRCATNLQCRVQRVKRV